MSSSISEPFLLTTHAIPNKWDGSRPHVYASGDKQSKRYVTVTAEGEGVHVYDLSSLHSVISYSQSSHTIFSGPAVTVHNTKGDARICTTYAVMKSGPNIPSSDADRTIWVMSQDLSGSLLKPETRTVVIPHTVARITLLDSSSGHLLLFSSQGDFSIMSPELNIVRTHEVSNDGDQPNGVFVFPKEACSFYESGETADTVVVVFSRSSDSLRIRVLTIGDENETSEGRIPLLGSVSSGVSSCSVSGVVSFLSSSGHWNAYQIYASPGSPLHISSIGEPLQLSRLPAVKNQPEKVPFSDCVSLLPISTSLSLCAYLSTPPSPVILIQLWDLRYGVVVDTHSLAIPSSLSSSAREGLRVYLAATEDNHVILILSPTKSSVKASERSAIYIIPLAAGLKSRLSNAMGRAAATAQWLVLPKGSGPLSGLDEHRAQLLAKMEVAMAKNDPAQADESFFNWVKEQSKNNSSPTFEYEFTKRLLNITLAPEKEKSNYSPRIVQFLLERSVITANMVEKGYLAALRQRSDWGTIVRSFDTVADITEDEIMLLLGEVITNQRVLIQSDTMDVDPSQGGSVASLETYLSACVSYRTSPPALRTAFRKYISNAEDIVAVLEILEGWISGGTRDYIQTLLSGVAKNANIEQQPSAAPPYHNTINFLQIVFDSSFVALLQHASARQAIENILAQVQPEVELYERLEQLRGALEPFSKLHARAAKEKAESAPKETPAEWRARRKRQAEQTAIGIGLYRLEELTI